MCAAQVQEQFKEIVLDARQDDFYRKHMYLNYGDVGLSVKALVEKFAGTNAKHKQVWQWFKTGTERRGCMAGQLSCIPEAGECVWVEACARMASI